MAFVIIILWGASPQGSGIRVYSTARWPGGNRLSSVDPWVHRRFEGRALSWLIVARTKYVSLSR